MTNPQPAEPPSDEQRETLQKAIENLAAFIRQSPSPRPFCPGTMLEIISDEVQRLIRERDEAMKRHAIIQRNHGEAIGREASERMARKAAEAEVARLRTTVPASVGADTQWHQIETAPKDGTRILAARSSDGRVGLSWWDNKGNRWASYSRLHQPTHWILLPPLPA